MESIKTSRLFFPRQLQKLKPNKSIQELSISVNITSFLPHLNVSVEIQNSKETVNYIHFQNGSRVGHPDSMSAWRCSKENWLKLATEEILEFLEQCCFEGRHIEVLKLFADSGRHHEFFQGIGRFSTEKDLSVVELIIDNRDAELSDVLGVLKNFEVEDVTIMMKKVTQAHFELLKQFPRLCTRSCTFKLNEMLDEETWDVIENRLDCVQGFMFHVVQPSELAYKKHHFWDIQLLRMVQHEEIEELKISFTTLNTFFTNVCASIQIYKHPEEKVHYLQSNSKCQIGDMDDMSTWSTGKHPFCQQALLEISPFLKTVFWNDDQRCSTEKIMKKLTFSSDSKHAAYQNLLKELRRELVWWKVQILEMNLENPTSELGANFNIVEGVHFTTGAMSHSSPYNLMALEKEIRKLNASVKKFTIFYKEPLSEEAAEDLEMQDFDAHYGQVSEGRKNVVIVRKPENEVRQRKVPEVVTL